MSPRHKMAGIVLDPKAPTSKESWWIGLDRLQFAEELKRRHPDVRASEEGRKPQRYWNGSPS